MLSVFQLDQASDMPLYRQLYEEIKGSILSGRLVPGERLPATRELAGLLGLNRTTVSAAYELLESEGLVKGHVGRGSFVSDEFANAATGLDWNRILDSTETSAPPPLSISEEGISFASPRPSENLFPLEDFRRSCEEVIRGQGVTGILQLGSPNGYAPLRHYLLEAARREGVARPDDDVLITSGCQQALDLIQRVLVRPGDPVLLEDPVYPGLKNVFARGGAQVIGVAVSANGMEVDHLERTLAKERPKLLAVTSNFQNPTGATLPLGSRQALRKMARDAGVVIVENDTYGGLRYEGEALPTIKQLDPLDDVILLRSFSKIAFPGLRVGWVIGPHAVLSRLAEAKQWADLHTDQLSQAVLLRFVESGRLEAHRARVLAAGRERLAAVLDACERYFPPGTRFTRPQGGMNLWVRLPEPLDAGELLARVQRENVTYLPGRYFAVSRYEPGSFRLSFAGTAPQKIRDGVRILGKIFANEVERVRASRNLEPAPAIV
jgi:2-aminoadipate transaminase